MDMKSTFDYYIDDVDAVYNWCNEMYLNKFSRYFDIVHKLYSRFNSINSPITDEELESILIDIPLQLFSASEELNKFRLQSSVIKLKKKEKKSNIMNNISLASLSSETKRKEEADVLTIEDEILVMAVSSVITRVENDISFSRELIMGAKKIWDGRRSTEQSNPVSEVPESEVKDDLPDYPFGC